MSPRGTHGRTTARDASTANRPGWLGRKIVLAATLAGLLLAAVTLVVFNGSTSSLPAAPSASPATSPPAMVEIEQIEARSTLIPLEQQANGEMEVPDVTTPMQAGWYSLGVVPGEVGPAAIVGHVNGGGEPGIFHRLDELTVGDAAQVTREDGQVLTFRVYDVEEMSKDEFPTARVYGNTDGSELRLITCGGEFLGGDLGYDENVIAYLRLEGSAPA